MDIRSAHVIRIQNDHSGKGNPLADGTTPDQVASDDSVWFDVLRIDEFTQINPNTAQASVTGVTGATPTQALRYVLKWQDGPQDHPNTMRKMKTIKITNPDNDAQWVKLDIIEHMSIVLPNTGNASVTGVTGAKPTQAIVHVFGNKSDNTIRQSDVITLHSIDVSSIDMTQYPIKWADYQHVMVSGTQDTSQSLDVEIPKQFTMVFPNTSDGNILTQTPGGKPTQATAWVMKNKDVKAAINQQIVSP